MFHLAYLLIFITGVWTSPLAEAWTGSAHSRKDLKINLRRSINRTTSLQGTENVGVFDPTYATKELNAILIKYANASRFLDGIGLNPDTHPEGGYPPFTAPTVSELNTTSPSDSPAPILPGDSTEDEASTIIGVPGVAPGTAMMPLRDDVSGTLDILYYGPLNFGTPAQPLTVDIDTGSADLWVPVNCKDCDNGQFYPKKSSTYKSTGKKFSVTYGSGDVSGSLAQDTVSIGSLTVEQQAFGAVRSESTDFQDEPNSGLLGLAFGSIATSKKPTFFENLLAQKKLTSSIFSVHLTRNGKTGSQLCFGCYDATKALGTSTVMWNPLLSRTYWSISMDGLSSSPTQSVSTDLIAAIDTGTTLIYVPDDVAAQFYGLIPGSQSAMQYGAGFYTFPCAGPPVVSLSFNGNPFAVHQSDFNLGRTSADSEDCVGGILAMGSGFPSNLAIIGDEFLKSWYSVYDYGGDRVGFAPSINNQ